MKNLNLVFNTLFLSLFLIACSKSEPDTEQAKIFESDQSSIPETLAKSGPGLEWMIYCEGLCEECSGKGLKVRPLVYQCPCEEDCVLKVTRVQVGGEVGEGEHSMLGKAQVDSLLGIYGTFGDQLERTMASKYGGISYRVNRVAVYASPSSMALKYYVITSDNEEVSLTYFSDGEGDIAYEIDCNGSCIAASAKCTEQVTLSDPIKIQCTCEGDCHMDVTPVETGEE